MTYRTADSPRALFLVPTPSARQDINSDSLRSTSTICAGLLVLLLPLAGCGVVSTTPGSITPDAVLTGHVHGGQQPVIGAFVTLYAPGITGYGTQSIALATATTDGAGNFTLPRPYTTPCPANTPLTYIVATGGNPGAGPNSFLAEAALLPPCAGLSASTFINISEVTTVAAAYALAPFATLSAGATNISTSTANILGLGNALGPASNLADTATGNARAATSVPGVVLPTNEINTLANILAACVNTNTNGVPSTTCNTLFTAATPPNGTAPADTFQAAIDIALNPGHNAATLYGLATAIAPFQPTLGTAPSDFAVGIQYTGGLIANSVETTGIDIDSAGNAWAVAFGNGPLSISPNVTKIAPTGLFLSGPTGYLNGKLSQPFGIAIDNNGNVFATDRANNRIVQMSSSGVFSSNLQAPSINGPVALAVDNGNSFWIPDVLQKTTVTHMTAAGLDDVGSPYPNQAIPLGVAIDTGGNIWVVNSQLVSVGGTGAGFLSKFTPSGGGAYTQLGPFSTGANTQPFDVAIDNSNGAWVTDHNGVAHFNSAGVQQSTDGGYSQSTATGPQSVIVDGLNRTWVSNTAFDTSGNPLGVPGSVTAFDNAGNLLSPSSTTTPAGLFLGYTAVGTIPQRPFSPQGLKIDASGNLWITGTNTTTQTVTELIGIAAPVTTPLSVAVSSGKLGTLP